MTALPRSDWALRWVMVLLVLDATFWAARCVQVERSLNRGRPVQSEFMAVRWGIFCLRFLLVSLLPSVLLLFEAGVDALALLGFGIFVDRLAFYGLAVRETSEAEVARVESILRSAGSN